MDVYINHNGRDFDIQAPKDKLYYYDINSLYPTVMNNVDMPVGKPIAFTVDLF